VRGERRARAAKRARAIKRPKVAKVVKLKLVKKRAAPEYAFSPEDFVVYPTHGVGKVMVIETQVIAGHRMELFVIAFDRDRMTLRVPVAKAETSGLRRLSTRKVMETALVTLKGRARVKRTMWSRRAQEYEAKINSGDPVSIAEVVRDLHRNAGQPDQSFSERQIYEAARDRLASELAAVERTDMETATEKLEGLLAAA
jgi:CarD family transcriptional regulator